MAKFFAISETDIVGSEDALNFPPSLAAVSATALFAAFPPGPPPDYYIFNLNGAIVPTSSITSFAHIISAVPFAVGAGEVHQVWKADSGDSYLVGSGGVASTDTLFGLIATVGAPGKTNGTEQQLNQFFFKFEDRIFGSDEDDKLCGWAEDDVIFGMEGDDEFYYGEGMGKDKIMDLKKNDDEVIFDEDLVDSFKQLKKDVKLKNDKLVIKFDSDDQLTIYGIDTLKQLKKVAAFDDFTDFS
jgi:hypothetical protein